MATDRGAGGPQDGRLAFLGSTLWTKAHDVEVRGTLAYCAYLDGLQSGRRLPTPVDLMTDMDRSYLDSQPPAAMVRDYIAGMTDDFFLSQAAAIGCVIPEKR